MMNPPVISNSGSLEDCHTNFFALTDLCGIRWRKFVLIEPPNEPLKDPILRSYARCLRENILCVWRRISTKKVDTFQNNLYNTQVPNSVTFPPLSLKTSKELWIFWYGEEPDLNELVVPELMKPTVETAEGSYENGISYECRSLLFKALHNLIERCLLSRGVMRLGKWFVQPCTRQNCSIEKGYHHMSFSFGFFVHGESTVCTSIDLRNHPNVRRLTLDHVKEAALNSDFNQHPVILAPFGLAGTLTGKYYKPSDPVTKKTLKEWSIFYPLLRKTEYHYPPVVEVIAGGVKMCYPAKYVLLTDIDDEDFSFSSIPKMFQQDDMNEIENENKIITPVGIENVVGERVWQECVVSSQILATNGDEESNGETSNDTEPNFEHPTTRAVCNCTIRKNPNKQSNCCFNHHHSSSQLMADISSAITSMGSPSSPELSPYFAYPPSVSPPEYESQALPIPSPNQLSSQYELQNFLNSSSDYDDTHSPFVLTDQQPNSSLTPNPSPDSVNEKVNANEQIPLDENIKDSGKFVSDDDHKEKLLQLKTEISKNINMSTSNTTTMDSSRMSAPIDLNINIKTEPSEIDMDIDGNPMHDSSFLNNALENIFGEGNLNENGNETKMSFDSGDQSKKLENERKEENFNDSSDSDDDDDTDDDSDDSTDSDDESDKSSGSENDEDDDASDDEKKHEPNKNTDDVSKKSKLLSAGEESNEVVSKSQSSKECDADGKRLNDNAESSAISDLNAPHQSDRNIEHNEESNKTTSSDKLNESAKSNEKLEGINLDNLESGNNQFNLIRGSGSLRASDNLSCDDTLPADLIADNHSNISDSDVGDFPDDGNMDESSNDSAKSSGSHDFVSHLTTKSSDSRPSENQSSANRSKDEPKNSDDLSYSVNFLDDLNSSESSDSNISDKNVKSSASFNLARDSSKTLESNSSGGDHDAQIKSSPNSDSKMKGSALSIVTSLDSAIGSKSVEDDSTLLDLHTDNISDDEYDIKPESISIRNSENISVNAVRNNENFESIANYISPAPTSLNAIISADYSNLSDNNDTNSNDNNRECNDNKRLDASTSSNKAESSDQADSKDKDAPNSENSVATSLLESKESANEFTASADNKNRSPFRIENSAKDKSGASSSGGDKIQSDALLTSDNNGGKEDNTDGDSSSNMKMAFSLNSNSLSKGDNNSSSESNANVSDVPKASDGSNDGKSRSESCKKPEDDIEFSLQFLDDHSMHDSNQSAILDNLIGDSNKGKNDPELDQLLPTTSTSIAGLDLDSESLSQIMDSIKASDDDRKRRSHSNSPSGSNIADGLLISSNANQQGGSNANQSDECFNENLPTYISPSRDHHSDANDNANDKSSHSANMGDENIDASSDIGKIFGSSERLSESARSKDASGNNETTKIRSAADLIRELESKESTKEFASEQNTQSLKTEDNSSSSASISTKKSSQSKNSDDSSKKSSEISKAKKYSDNDPNKSSSSNSNRSSKSSKKSKHGKVESSSSSSSKKSSKTSSKTDKSSKPSTAESSKQNENSNVSANQMSSSKKAKETTSSKRIVKSMKRPHRTICSTTTMAVKRNVYNYESIAALMNTPILGTQNQDAQDEYNDSPQMLYDFSTWEAWMNHPVKRFKPGEPYSTRAIFKELQELYSKQNVRLVDAKKNPPNSVESKSVSDGLQTSDEDADHDYYNDSGSQHSNLSDYDLNSPDILCSPTNFSDIYFEGHRNLSLQSDIANTADPDCSDNSNEGSMQEWPYSSSSSSKFLVSSKYAPLTNIAPTQTYLQHSFVYRPSWEQNAQGRSNNKKNKNSMSSNKAGSSSNKLKNRNKNKNNSATNKTDLNSKTSANSKIDDIFKMGGNDFKSLSKEIGCNSPSNKYGSRQSNVMIKEEPVSDQEQRNYSESDSDSESDKNKSSKKKFDKNSNAKKMDKSKQDGKNKRSGSKNAIKSENQNDNRTDDSSSYDNNGNSDENSNDSGQNNNLMQDQNAAIKCENDEIEAESAQGTTGDLMSLKSDAIKMESSDLKETNNLDKSSSSVDEFENEKPSKIVTVTTSLQYDSEIYNDEVNLRKFHKYQRNMELSNLTHIAQIETITEAFASEPGTSANIENMPHHQLGHSSSSDSDSDDSDANDLDDSDNSSCDECAAGPCSPSILPPLAYTSTGSSSSTSVSSYCNKNFNYLENIAQPVQRLPETNALILNLLLYDTSLNVFKDHNFNSCSLCVCHPASDGTFGNVRGADSGRYLPMNGTSFSDSLSPTPLNVNSIGQFETESDRNKRSKSSLMGCVDMDPIHCSCGYSAIVNRRLSHKSGLFYEDENEITGMAEDPNELKLREKPSALFKDLAGTPDDLAFSMEKICGSVSQVIMDYIQEQCTCVQNSANSVQRSIRFANNACFYNIEDSFMNVVEFCDAQDIIRVALNNSKLESQYKSRKSNALVKSGAIHTNVHKWPYIKACIPPNNKDVLKFMQMLLPVLQGSFNKKYMMRMWEAPYAIQGPLTWRQFHRLASTHSGQCEPQPIPSIIVGHEKEWLSVSPFAIQYWDQLMLEPYSYTRDVAYIVIAPDNEYIVDEAKQFFKELSTMYEMCKLGRHCPIKGCDGILRSGKNTTDIINDEFEELYALFEDNKTIEIIKSYVQTCQQHLVPYLTNISSDKSILDPEPEGFNIKDFCYRDKSMSSPMFQPDTPEFSYGSGENKEQNSSFENECDSNASYSNAQTPTPAAPVSNEPVTLTGSNQNEDEIPPCIMIYVLNPLSFGHESEDLQRLSCIALLRSYSKILNAVPESIRNNIKLQIISMESILEMGQNCDLLRASDEMRCLALSIFSQCRRNLTHDVTAKILTGFGTAANLQMVIKNKDCMNRAPYKLYAPPYILSGREETIESSEVFGASTVDTPSSVLYCNYCLSQDQKWLLAVATDERGELLETVTINIEVANSEPNQPNRGDSIRRQSLQKLMDFIVGIISQTSQQWRIVIGRIGRIGHGELKAWSWLLCKSSLVKISKQLKDVCEQCSMMYLHSCSSGCRRSSVIGMPSACQRDVSGMSTSSPSIVSACLLTLEPDTSFRILSDQFTPDERFSQIAMQSTLSTPSDLSCTHILVLPINASAQAVQTYPEHHITDFSADELFVSLGNSEQGMGGIGGLNNNMNSINGINNMNINNMNNNMNVMNGIGGLNNMNGMNMNMNSGNALRMNGLGALNNINDLSVNNINGLGDVNSINGLNSINGIECMDSIEGIDPMEGMDPIDAIDAMEAMDGMDDVNMNGIEDFFSNDWENEIQLPTDNPQDDPTLEQKLDANANPNDVDPSMLEHKAELVQDSKQDLDQKPNANLMLSVNMSGLGHQVKMESNCDTGNMQMQLHNTSDEFGQMMPQPLAIGFMVSTAPINRMPSWFWANCPQLENVNPVFLKSSLHIHSPLIHQNSTEYVNQRFSHASIHPLDSAYTADTMRYILESYNFLSWLAIDPNTNDRISCLPAHIQVLMQLYNMVAAFT